MDLNIFLEKLWNQYSTENPSAKRVKNIFENEGERVENDHIAFRTFNHPSIDIQVLSKPFRKLGYIEKGDYFFEKKHLVAKHYEHPGRSDAPRIFISQLILEEFSDYLQETILKSINSVDKTIYQSDDLIFSGTVWGTPDYETYLKLRNESEYAAWLYVYGFRVNHFTVNINALCKHDTIEKVNLFLKENGFLLNSSGGEIKGSSEALLEQSSIMADHQEIQFIDRKEKIPSCYYEFAKRYPDANGDLFSGFIAKSADKIFESTNYYKEE